MQERLDILYRDNQLIAINKPPGLLVHRSRIDLLELKPRTGRRHQLRR